MHEGEARPAAHARRRRPSRRALIVIGSVLAVALVLVAAEVTRRTLAEQEDVRADPTFYALPTPLPGGDPGEIIRIEEIESAPVGTKAWRVIYHSRALDGGDDAVSGVVIVPDGPAPEGGRTVISWAHPTTGAAAKCAPSLGFDPFQYIEGMHELLAEGYAIAATDYPGLGVAGASSYLLGIPESNSVLDIVRAARHIDGAEAGDRLVLWGHSQGGQAVLFAAQRVARYAPELELEGVAVAAPAANLNALMTDDIVNLSGVTIASLAIPAYEAAYADRYSSSEITGILTPAGLAATSDMAALCLLTQTKELHAIADPLVGGYVRSAPATTEPWQTLLEENSAGSVPISVPVFVGQGEADELVLPSATEGYVKLLCSQDADVSFHRYPGITHGLAAYAALPDLLLWLPTLNGERPPSGDCS